MGVRLVLVGVQPHRGHNQAETLVREADEHIMLDQGFWGPFFTRTAPAAAPVAAAQADPRAIGRGFALEWVERASRDEVRRLLGRAPRIPVELDTQLLT